MTRVFRRLLRRVGIDVPFSRVVCPEEVKTIAIDPQWRATVTVRRQMVFLERPQEGDLRDLVPIAYDANFARSVQASPDATDIGHRPLGVNTLVYWMPHEPIIEYAVYTHERSWTTPGDEVKDVLCTEVTCRGKVARMTLEIAAPTTYETAVAFRLTGWHRLATERRLMKKALTEIETSRRRPSIRNAGTRVEWTVTRPRKGQRFVCIAFTSKGLAAWQQVLENTSIRGRLRRLVRLRPREGRRADPGRVLLPR